MLATLLHIAAFLALAIGIAHSYLGERYILMRLFRRGDLPQLFGGQEFTVRTLRFAWHLTSVAWWGFAALLVLLARPPVTGRDIALVIGVTFLVTAVATFAGSRGRHLVWPVFLVIAIVAFYASGAQTG